jgi:hypothetical protein
VRCLVTAVRHAGKVSAGLSGSRCMCGMGTAIATAPPSIAFLFLRPLAPAMEGWRQPRPPGKTPPSWDPRCSGRCGAAAARLPPAPAAHAPSTPRPPLAASPDICPRAARAPGTRQTDKKMDGDTILDCVRWTINCHRQPWHSVPRQRARQTDRQSTVRGIRGTPFPRKEPDTQTDSQSSQVILSNMGEETDKCTCVQGHHGQTQRDVRHNLPLARHTELAMLSRLRPLQVGKWN